MDRLDPAVPVWYKVLSHVSNIQSMHYFKPNFLISVGNPIPIPTLWYELVWTPVMFYDLYFPIKKIPISFPIKTRFPDPLRWLNWNSNIYCSLWLKFLTHISRLLRAFDVSFFVKSRVYQIPTRVNRTNYSFIFLLHYLTSTSNDKIRNL